MATPSRTAGERAAQTVLWIYSALVFLFLTLPIVIIIPLSFNAEPYFTITEGMLNLDARAFSWRWYMDIFQNGMINPNQPAWSWPWLKDAWQNAQWIHSAKNSLAVAVGTTVLSTILGTLAALGLSHPRMPARVLITSIVISPMIVPIIISSAGIFFFFSQISLTNTYIGLVLAHSVLGVPFVVITVTATLAGFDTSLIRAGRILGAAPHIVFRKVIGPLILPGLVSGALFAFIASFDEVVMVIFLADYDQRTIPRQMWSGVREQISPTILAVATILVVLSVIMLATVELLRRRSERLRGVKPQ
jgi:putative spermidine/putrescine transport system permease protein